jgi:Ni/Co efflux regulator RcnB
MFKRTVLAAIAISMLAVPVAQAQQRHEGSRQGQHYSHQHKRDFHAPRRHEVRRHHNSRSHWSRGKRIPEWQRRQAIRDHYRYGLRRPGRGQQWVRVDNDFLLISLGSGIIASIIVGR